MKVVLFGATGFSGQLVLQKLLEEGHEVTVLVRTPSKLNHLSLKPVVISGNVMNEKVLIRVLSGQDAVINCLGIGGKGDGKPNSFVSDATQKIINQMEQQGVKRLIAMSNVGAGDSAKFQPWFFRKLILPYFMKWLKVIIDDKNVMETNIRKSNLDWTIVRCPNITDKAKKGKIKASLDGKGLKLSITNPDVATFLVQQLADHQFIHQSLSISN